MPARSVTVRFSDEELRRIDQVLEEGRFSSRSELLRAALALLTADHAERALADAVGAIYGPPASQEPAWGLEAWEASAPARSSR